MKVIVCFDEVRVTVPCGDGDIPVSELIAKAVHRYKRAAGKGSDVDVSVTSLKTISGGGLLDPDDLLNDVVDDREQLIAEFDEPGRSPQPHLLPYHLHNGGDRDGGTASSNCSTGGGVSPDVFQSGDAVAINASSTTTDSIVTIPPFLPPRPNSSSSSSRRHHHQHRNSSSSSSTNNTGSHVVDTNNATDVVVVTPRDLTIGSNLRVRRGSDPGLNILDTLVKEASSAKPIAASRPTITRRESVRESDDPKSELSEDERRMRMAAYGSLDRKRFSHKFTRDITRASLSNRPEIARWMENQERMMEAAAMKKVEPLKVKDITDNTDSVHDESRSLVTIQNEGGPLGIHAVPAYDDSNHAMGLLIQSVEPGRPVERDGRIVPNDIVVEINGLDLYDVPFLRAQDIFRSAMQSSQIDLTVVKGQPAQTPSSSISPTSPVDSDHHHHHQQPVLPKSNNVNNKSKQRQAPPPPVMPKPRNHVPSKPSPLTLPTSAGGSTTTASSIPMDSDSMSSEIHQNRISSPYNNGHDNLLTPPPSSQQQAQFSRQQQRHDSTQSTNHHHHHRHHSQNSSSSSCSSIPPSSSSTSSKQQQQHHNGTPGTTSTTNTSSISNPVIKPGPPIRPPKKTPAPAIPSRSPKTALTTTTSHSPSEAPININALTNTRRIGKRISIQLKKGLIGLGFSVTSRDNQTDGECPIYIRNILPKGAAIQDGRLRIGDRLLEVDGVEMTGKNQAEAVQLLRLLPEGSLVDLVVSRQEEVDDRFKVPRPLDSSNGKVTKDSGDGDVAVTNNNTKTLDTMGLDEAVDLDDVDALSTSQPKLKGNGNDPDSPPGVTKEKLTLRIPLNDTGSAGLGVSVKGKTQTKALGLVEDLGIFIKTVLQGGAASKDGRLQVNDQLLEVNDFNLVGLTNTAAMEALRSAMLDDNQLPGGYIILSVARHSNSGTMSPSLFQYGDTAEHPHSNPNTHPSSNANGAIFHQRSSSSNDSSVHTPSSAFIDDNDMPSPIPPVRSKRVGQLRDKFNELSNAIRNESYTKATHESLNESSSFSNIMPPSPSKPAQPLQPLQPINSVSENDDDKDVYAVSSKMQRPHSTIGFLHGPKMSQSSSVSDDEAFRRASTASSKDDSDLSPQGDLILPFAREGFGRQSMSEKRKGHIDPRSTEVYKQAKANKENKGGFLNRRVRSFHVTGMQGAHSRNASPNGNRNPAADSKTVPEASQPELHDSTYHPPSHPSNPNNAFNLKRSSSVEDLSQSTDRPPPIPPHPQSHNNGGGSSSPHQQTLEASPAWQTRFGRARACNDSFRAAVDRSYDIMDPNPMDTLEEESMENSAFNLDPSFSGRSSISSEDTNSLKRQKGKDKDKKGGGGLLKGFLRFGKGRKSNEEALRRSRSEERSGQKNNNNQAPRRAEHSMDRNNASSRSKDTSDHGFYPVVLESSQPHNTQNTRGRRASQQENERIEEEYARLREHHVSEQRLRSQSVDPSAGRTGSGSVSSGSGVVVYPERSSPFQPYVGPGGQQHQHHHHQQQHHGPNTNTNMQKDPRHIHPAAMAQGSNSTTSHPHHNYHHQYNQDPSDARSNIKQANLSRAEKIQQLRTMYQQKHKQREGVYPLDDTEEQYERQIQQMEHKWASGHTPPDVGRHDMESPVFFDRNRPIDHGHPSTRVYGSSTSMTNISSNNNSSTTTTTAFSHYHQQQQQQRHPHQLHYTHSASSGSSNSNRQQHQQQPRSRPQSRGATGGGGGGTLPRDGGGSSATSYYQQDEERHPQFYSHQSHQSHHQQQQQYYHHRSSPPPASSSSYYPLPPQQSQSQPQHHHQQRHPYHQQQQQQQYQHHNLPHVQHSPRVNSSQEEITSFSGYNEYDQDDGGFDHSYHQQQQQRQHQYNYNHKSSNHSSTSNYSQDRHRDGSTSRGGSSSTTPINIPQQHQRFRTSPTPQFLSSSLPYPPHHNHNHNHYNNHHNSSNHPDPAKV